MKLHTIQSFISAPRKVLTKQKHRTRVHETPVAYLLHLYVTVWEDLKGGPPLIPLLQLQAGKCFSSKSRFSCLLSSRPLCCVILLFSTAVISDAHGSQTMQMTRVGCMRFPVKILLFLAGWHPGLVLTKLKKKQKKKNNGDKFRCCWEKESRTLSIPAL